MKDTCTADAQLITVLGPSSSLASALLAAECLPVSKSPSQTRILPRGLSFFILCDVQRGISNQGSGLK
jgi:hypothetical protein